MAKKTIPEPCMYFDTRKNLRTMPAWQCKRKTQYTLQFCDVHMHHYFMLKGKILMEVD